MHAGEYEFNTSEIVKRLDGADEDMEAQICKEYGIDPSSVYDVMVSRGYTWEDRWVKEEPRFPWQS